MNNNVEALYVVEFGDAAGQQYTNGGVAVLETTRVFGGDSGYYYVGTFNIDKDQLSANIQVVRHDPAWQSAWGDKADNFSIILSGKITNNVIAGHMQRVGIDIQLPVRLTRKAELP
jgi:hypothetical protein